MSNKIIEATTCETVEEFLTKIPKHMQKHITAELKQEITTMCSNDDIGGMYSESILVHSDLVEKYSSAPSTYVRAVKFVSYLNMGKKTYEAFVLSHPEKYREYKAQAEVDGWDLGKLRNKLSLKGANFKKTKLVTTLLARTMVPLAVAFNHHRYGAVKKLAYLYENAESERVQMESADKLLTHLGLDREDLNLEAEVKQNNTNIVAVLAGALDKMVSLHQQEKEINPLRSNASILDGVVAAATKDVE